MEGNDPALIALPHRLRVQDVPAAYREIEARRGEGAVVVDFGGVEDFDSSALALLGHLRACAADVRVINVPAAVDRSFRASLGGTPPAPARDAPALDLPTRVLHSISAGFLAQMRSVTRFLVLLGDEIYYTASFLRKRRGVYPGEIRNQLYFMGYKSYPITCMLVFLIGVTIALTLTGQLKLYGADIYLADIIGYGMLRELVPLMVGIILAGKVGAAITAELSTMTVLEEVDALKTMGVVPARFLMVPRLLAMTMAVPFLVVLADAVGIAGGILVARFSLDIIPSAFIREMQTTVDLGDFLIGIVKSLVFGWAVVVASGYKGLTVGRSAGEVGRATTESVVLSISLIILIDCVFALILY